ncbi:hypothetical protein RF11_01993 [Thelohanellus kitauei]|uniref:Uncharacterized protein n=1 Tax=Thelohanellus kitauei TaxID=669202 RepID=A0A0C2N290_THEKT|nr:hypothetical protein RF11_01993 [Thelohanellus kitauei]
MSSSGSIIHWDIRKFRRPLKVLHVCDHRPHPRPMCSTIGISYTAQTGIMVSLCDARDIYVHDMVKFESTKIDVHLNINTSRYSNSIFSSKVEHYNSSCSDLVSISGGTAPIILDITDSSLGSVSSLYNHLLPITSSYIFSTRPMVITSSEDGMLIPWMPSSDQEEDIL